MGLKLSYYTLFTDVLNKKEDRVLFCTRTGEALVIKSHIYDKLNSGDFDGLENSDFERLVDVKAIVPEEENELLQLVTENNSAIEQESSLYEVIQPTASCQLGCDYCGQSHAKVGLATELYDKIIDRIKVKAMSGKYNGMYIGWFGGEPLVGLKQIRDLTPKLMALAREFDMPYAAKIVTNGLSLKENIFVELVDEHKIDHIEVTLDGTGIYHDSRRHTKEGNATFDIIFKNLVSIFNREDFYDKNCQISIRCNVDERNVDGVSPLIDLLYSHNLQHKISYFYPVGVYSWAQNDAHKKSITKEEFAEMEVGWLMELIQKEFSVRLLPGRVKKVCMSVSNTSEMFDAYGNIFDCTEVSYTPVYENTNYIKGNLKFPAESISSERSFRNWNAEILDGKFPCHSCKMLPVCGGGCPKSWHEDMRACPTAKFNIKDKLTLSYIVSQKKLSELVEAVTD